MKILAMVLAIGSALFVVEDRALSQSKSVSTETISREDLEAEISRRRSKREQQKRADFKP